MSALDHKLFAVRSEGPRVALCGRHGPSPDEPQRNAPFGPSGEVRPLSALLPAFLGHFTRDSASGTQNLALTTSAL